MPPVSEAKAIADYERGFPPCLPADVRRGLLRQHRRLQPRRALAMLTDSTYREEFLDQLTAEMRTSLKARAAYLRRKQRVPA